MTKATQTVETRCLHCGVTLMWTWALCISLPKDWPGYFNCGRHPASPPQPEQAP